jgi:membrane-associated phospholipid phosphatase
MDSDVARAAQTLADHAIVFLLLAVAIVGLALGAVVVLVRAARRFQEPLIQGWTRLFTQARRIPFLGPVGAGVRAVVPTRYVALHLALGLLGTAAVVGFAIIAEEVVAGKTIAAFDHAFANALHDQASPRWQQAFRVITWFGSGAALAVASVVVAAGLLIRRDYVLATGWIIAQVGAAVLNVTLKSAFERTRPASAEALDLASWSFPSGHAMGTFVFCGLGAYLVLRSTRSWTMAAIVVAVALAWCLVMGFTRLYLGVHFASDVVAGLVAATAWVAVCVSGIEVGLRRMNAGRRSILSS